MFPASSRGTEVIGGRSCSPGVSRRSRLALLCAGARQHRRLPRGARAGPAWACPSSSWALETTWRGRNPRRVPRRRRRSRAKPAVATAGVPRELAHAPSDRASGAPPTYPCRLGDAALPSLEVRVASPFSSSFVAPMAFGLLVACGGQIAVGGTTSGSASVTTVDYADGGREWRVVAGDVARVRRNGLRCVLGETTRASRPAPSRPIPPPWTSFCAAGQDVRLSHCNGYRVVDVSYPAAQRTYFYYDVLSGLISSAILFSACRIRRNQSPAARATARRTRSAGRIDWDEVGPPPRAR